MGFFRQQRDDTAALVSRGLSRTDALHWVENGGRPYLLPEFEDSLTALLVGKLEFGSDEGGRRTRRRGRGAVALGDLTARWVFSAGGRNGLLMGGSITEIARSAHDVVAIAAAALSDRARLSGRLSSEDWHREQLAIRSPNAAHYEEVLRAWHQEVMRRVDEFRSAWDEEDEEADKAWDDEDER